MSQQVWAGVDAGKSDHHCVAIDAEGQRLLSRRVANDETALLELIDAVTAQADGGDVTWAIDLNAGGAALLITLLIAAEQRLLYIPAAPSTTPRPATAATAKPTPKTPPSSPTKLGCAATCSRCDSVMTSRSSCAS
ncbi:transposase family protein [Mycobacterium xenopi 4042]|uniref:Transposase family protein n=1 Tax=Mycobacterium xenopi 4042 TaxID=1299334 RepID=X8CA38_MYCXE|nr:transposase family protein [Mycobacterium xenopi 4042]